MATIIQERSTGNIRELLRHFNTRCLAETVAPAVGGDGDLDIAGCRELRHTSFTLSRWKSVGFDVRVAIREIRKDAWDNSVKINAGLGEGR